MKSIAGLTYEVTMLTPEGKRAIKNRTGYPKGLLLKTEEEINKKVSGL
jgi:hypothetical protein